MDRVADAQVLESGSRRGQASGQRVTTHPQAAESYRIPQTVADEIGLAVAEVESAAKGDDFERMREAIAALDERMDKHLAFARKSTAREYAESIGVALAVALLLRGFCGGSLPDPLGVDDPDPGDRGPHFRVEVCLTASGSRLPTRRSWNSAIPSAVTSSSSAIPPILPRTSSSAWWGCPVIRSSFATTRSSSTVNPWFVSVSPPMSIQRRSQPRGGARLRAVDREPWQ